MDGKSWQSTSLLSFHIFFCTICRCIVIMELSNDWPKIMIKDIYVFGQVNISFYICDCANSGFTNTPKTFQTHVRRHCDFHTILCIACSTFSGIFATLSDGNISLTPLAFHQKTVFYSIFLVLSSVVYFGTIAHDLSLFFNEIISVIARIVLWKPLLLNLLWIDLSQIGTGTERLKPFRKSRKPLLRSRFTKLINECSPCLLIDLGRSVRGFFSIFSLQSNILKNVDTVDLLNPFPLYFWFF